LFVTWKPHNEEEKQTSHIRVGRSTSPSGPFFDKDEVDLALGGGSIVIDTDSFVLNNEF